jgi:hypothetical protein
MKRMLPEIKNESIEVEYLGNNLVFKNHEDFCHFLESENLTLSSAGILYKNDTVGLVPGILNNWFTDRVELKNKAKEALKSGDMEKYEFFNTRQKVVKIMLNSIYGVLGLEIFRFYDRENAESVTLTGQTLIKASEKYVNNIFKEKLGKNDGDYIKYIDTDSLYMSSVDFLNKEMSYDDKLNFTVNLSLDISKKLNEFYPYFVKMFFNSEKNLIKILPDSVSIKAIWLAKKRYALYKAYNMDTDEKLALDGNNIEIKGFDVVRTSFPPVFRKFMGKFLKDLLTDVERISIDNDIIKFLEEINTLPILDLAKSTSCKFISLDKTKNYDPSDRKPFHSVLGTPAQVKASLMYNDLIDRMGLNKHTQKIFNGQKIKWAYLLDNPYGIDALAFKADGNDAKEILDFIEKYIDRSAMYEQELKSKLIEFYKVLSWNYPSLESRKAEEFFSF